MSDPIVEAIVGGISWSQNALIDRTRDLAEAEFCQQPSSTAPPIGWHVWHVARWADMLQESMTDQEEHWKQADFVARFRLDPNKLGLLQMGSTQSTQQATAVIVGLGQKPLIEYAQTVFDMTASALETLTLEDLYTPRESILRIDWSATPFAEGKGADVLLYNDLDFHVGHTDRHLGMVEALIGAMFSRKGTATI